MEKNTSVYEHSSVSKHCKLYPFYLKNICFEAEMLFSFFIVWHTFSTIQIWNCTFYNTKGNGKGKAFILDNEILDKREGISSLLFSFFILGRMWNQVKRVTRKNKIVYKEPECKGMHILTNLVDFQSLITSWSLEQWNVRWLTTFFSFFLTYIPIFVRSSNAGWMIQKKRLFNMQEK